MSIDVSHNLSKEIIWMFKQTPKPRRYQNLGKPAKKLLRDFVGIRIIRSKRAEWGLWLQLPLFPELDDGSDRHYSLMCVLMLFIR